MKLKLAGRDNRVGEAVSNGFLYWLIDEKGNSLHSEVQCKDFFTDAMWTEYVGEPSEVYGFKWKPGKIDVKQPFLYMAITAKEGLAKYADSLQEFMAEVDEKMDFRRTIVTAAKPDHLVLKFSNEWTTKPYLISAFTQLVRLGPLYKDEGVVKFLKTLKGNPLCAYDNHRLPKFAERMERLLKGERWPLEYSSYTDAHRAHALGGLCSINV